MLTNWRLLEIHLQFVLLFLEPQTASLHKLFISSIVFLQSPPLFYFESRLRKHSKFIWLKFSLDAQLFVAANREKIEGSGRISTETAFF